MRKKLKKIEKMKKKKNNMSLYLKAIKKKSIKIMKLYLKMS